MVGLLLAAKMPLSGAGDHGMAVACPGRKSTSEQKVSDTETPQEKIK